LEFVLGKFHQLLVLLFKFYYVYRINDDGNMYI